MVRLSIATRLWFAALAASALALTAAVGRASVAPSAEDWRALALFGLCAAVAHRFPIKVAGEVSCRLTNIFLVAGALVLPPALLPALVLLGLVPDTLLGPRRSGILARLLANAPPTTLAVLGAGLWFALIDGHNARGLGAALALGGAGVLLTLLQGLLLGVGLALHFRLPPHRTDALRPAALQADAAFAILGVAVAGLWRAESALLLLVLPLLILVHRLARTAHLARLAQVDVKTGLHNARHFEEALASELARAARTGRPLAVLFADLDHFKEINDRHGHAAGDRVLHSVGALLTATLRAGDVVARFGGEEFVALLPGTTPDEALFLAELLRAAVAAHPFALPDGAIVRRTASIGVATAPEDGATVEALLRVADAAMYRAKRTRDAVARTGALPSVPRLAPAEPAPPAPAPAPGPPRRARLILWGTIALGTLALALSLPPLWAARDWPLLAALVALGVAAEFVTIQIFESERQKYSLTFGAVVMLAAATALPAVAPLVAVVAALVHVVQRRQWRRGIGRALFNMAGPCLAAGVAAGAYRGLVPRLPDHPAITLLAAAAVTALFYGVNTGAVVLAMAAHTGRPPGVVFAEARWAAPATLALGLTGAFLGARFGALGPLNAALFALPLLVMRHTLGFAARKTGEALAIERAATAEAEGAHAEKEQTLRQLIDVVAAIIDARDQAVAGHSERVANYAVALAEELGLPPRERAYLHTAGLLHDLGKIAVPEAILHKPAKLTDEEFVVVKEHAAIGERILAEVRPLAEVARMVGDHHERYDGGGYPHREAGEAITLGGRIVAVADTLDSILSDRPYSKGKPLPWALEELRRCAGEHFDPQVVAALERIAAARGPGFFVPGRATPVAAEQATDLIPFRSAPTTGPLATPAVAPSADAAPPHPATPTAQRGA